MKHKKALVTLAYGDKHQYLFAKYSQKSFQRYAEKYGYDLLVFDQPFDTSPFARKRHLGWQKLLILSQEWSSSYDDITWLDSDIIINNYLAEDIGLYTDTQCVNACKTYSTPTEGIYNAARDVKRENFVSRGLTYVESPTAHEFHSARILNCDYFSDAISTGVFSVSVSRFKSYFEHIYYSFDETIAGDKGEMPFMSYYLQKECQVNWIKPEFNLITSTFEASFYPSLFWASHLKGKYSIFSKLNTLWKDLYLYRPRCEAYRQIFNCGYFIHFAGCHKNMRFLQSYLSKQNQKISDLFTNDY